MFSSITSFLLTNSINIVVSGSSSLEELNRSQNNTLKQTSGSEESFQVAVSMSREDRMEEYGALWGGKGAGKHGRARITPGRRVTLGIGNRLEGRGIQ